MRMISIFGKISKSGGTAARAQSLTFYAPPRDSIAIPASLMRGDDVRAGVVLGLALAQRPHHTCLGLQFLLGSTRLAWVYESSLGLQV